MKAFGNLEPGDTFRYQAFDGALCIKLPVVSKGCGDRVNAMLLEPFVLPGGWHLKVGDLLWVNAGAQIVKENS